MSKRSRRPDDVLILDLPDEMLQGSYIYLYERHRPIYEQEYRDMVENRVADLLDHPVIDAIEDGEAVTDEQLIDLEREMRRRLGGPGLELDEEKVKRAYRVEVDSFLAFMRYLFELDGLPDYREIVARQFEAFAQAHHLNAAQTGFLRTIRSQFLRRQKLSVADLYEVPFTRFGDDAVERLFDQAQIDGIMALTEQLRIKENHS